MLSTAIIFAPPAHIYLQLKGACELSPGSASWRTVLLLIFAGVASFLFLLMLLGLGVLG